MNTYINYDHIETVLAAATGHDLTRVDHLDYEIQPGDYDGQATVFYTTTEDVEHGRPDDRFGVITFDRTEQVEDHEDAHTATDLIATLRRLEHAGAEITLVEIPDNIAHQLLNRSQGQAA